MFNVENLAQGRGSNRAVLTLYMPSGESFSRTLELAPESCTAVDIDELAPHAPAVSDSLVLASWILKFEKPVARDTFWVSRAADGRVVGDHCF